MFAINHAATALLLKKRWHAAPLVWLLLSVQLLEIVWVVLNALGVERTMTETRVLFIGDIHLTYMPYSHSLLAAALMAAAAWATARNVFKSSGVALAIGIGVLSHIVLDLVTHAPDIAVVPWADNRIGLGLYSAAPLAAFMLELVYGVTCWWVYRGRRSLLAVIVVFNLANITIFVPEFPGMEGMLAGRPGWLVTLVALQIAVTLTLVGWLATPRVIVRNEREATGGWRA